MAAWSIFLLPEAMGQQCEGRVRERTWVVLGGAKLCAESEASQEHAWVPGFVSPLPFHRAADLKPCTPLLEEATTGPHRHNLILPRPSLS